MAVGGIVGGVMIGVELAKILIPLIQQLLANGKAPDGTSLTRQQINDLRTLNDQLTTQVAAELDAAAKT